MIRDANLYLPRELVGSVKLTIPRWQAPAIEPDVMLIMSQPGAQPKGRFECRTCLTSVCTMYNGPWARPLKNLASTRLVGSNGTEQKLVCPV
jgi:hypothetical protein